MPEKKELSLPAAAHRIGVSYEVARRQLFRGELTGRQNESGRWMVSMESVERAREARHQIARSAA